jgi:hypothetical protein
MTMRSMIGAVAAVCLAAVPCTYAQMGGKPDEKKTEKKTEKKAEKPAAKPAAAEKKTAMEAPKPPAEVAQLKFFDGSWACSGTSSPSPFGPGGKTTGTVRSHTDLGGFWQSGVVKSSGGGMPPMEGMFHMTYDPAMKQYVMLWVDSSGARGQENSSGWEGDKIVFSGDMNMGTQKMTMRDTFSKAAAGELKHSYEAQVDGKWTPMGDETCKKAATAAAAPAAKKE